MEEWFDAVAGFWCIGLLEETGESVFWQSMKTAELKQFWEGGSGRVFWTVLSLSRTSCCLAHLERMNIIWCRAKPAPSSDVSS